MKRLKKSTLDELAEKMPVLKEKESAECVGGHYYFVKDGGHIYYGGAHGTGDMMLIYNSGNLDKFMKLSVDQKYINSQDFSYCSNNDRMKILRASINYQSQIKWIDYNKYVTRFALADESNKIVAGDYQFDSGIWNTYSGPKVTTILLGENVSFTGTVSSLNSTINFLFAEVGTPDGWKHIDPDNLQDNRVIPTYTKPW